jgi:prepilin-type processing-associated H-X9-DG protein
MAFGGSAMVLSRHVPMARFSGLALLVGFAVLAAFGATISEASDGKDSPADSPPKPTMTQLRTRSVNNLKQLGLAMHNYHATTGSFPPAAVFDKDGKALLSWRVLLLPYLEQQNLAKEFHLDEAWDSERNKKLLSRMPKVFDVDLDDKKAGETVYTALVGKGTVFDGKKGIRVTDITDGTSNTIMLVESAHTVPWTKPEDLEYDADKPLPKLRHLGAGFNAGFCDGSVRFISTKVPEKTLRVLITRNDGEVPGEF